MKKRNPLDDDLFDEQMLYVIDGELMNKNNQGFTDNWYYGHTTKRFSWSI